jgi:hypothetical protein
MNCVEGSPLIHEIKSNMHKKYEITGKRIEGASEALCRLTLSKMGTGLDQESKNEASVLCE